MRVKPTGDGPPSVLPVDEAAPAEPARALDAVTGVAPTGPAAGVGRADAVEGVARPRLDPVAEVTRRLKAGEITAGDAVDLLIDAVVARHARPGEGPLAGDPVLADELKALLRQQLERDPHLASHVRRLGNRP